MTNDALNDFIFYSKYSRYLPEENRKENFKESVQRVFDMHWQHLENNHNTSTKNVEFCELFIEALDASKEGLIFGSQRALQFGGNKILINNTKLYNCSYSHCDRPRFFAELLWILLCGCGVGCSVHTEHVKKLPKINSPLNTIVLHEIEDSIEGWANAIELLTNSYFYGRDEVTFDYSLIRPKGSMISGGFIAPGPDGLRNSIEHIRIILESRIGEYLRPIDCFSINCHLADSVLSGGVRRSALSTLFDPNDLDMLNAKTNNWFINNPHFARSNNSCTMIRDKTTFEEFDKTFEAVKQFGEPGFAFVNHLDSGYNPCFEIGFQNLTIDNKTGWLFCNLTTMSGKDIDTEEKFYKACKLSAVIGTIQASYNKFNYLTETTHVLVDRDSMLGCSISGIMMHPEILLNPEILRKGVDIIRETNKKIAHLLGINPAKRLTAIKPDGNFSSMTGNTPGCHAAHSKRYIRRVQVNKEEESGIIYQKLNPKSIRESVWSNNGTDNVISFPIELPDNTIFKNQLSALQHLEYVKLLQENWVIYGNNECDSKINHNVSVTVLVDEHEWTDVENYIWDNRYYFSGVSMLAKSGDLIYNQAAYSEVLLPQELIDTYGNGIIFASGLIVDILDVFGDVWKACDIVKGIGEHIYTNENDVHDFLINENILLPSNYIDKPYGEVIKLKESCKNSLKLLLIKLGYPSKLSEYLTNFEDFNIFTDEIKKYLDAQLFERIEGLSIKRDIVRRIHKFSKKYFNENIELTLNSLKHVQLYHDWCALTSDQKEIDWNTIKWNNIEKINVNTLGASGCSGGACEITKI